MSTLKKPDDKSSSTNQKDDDDEMDRLARQMLLEEAKRNKIRAETQGALGWQRRSLVTNRKFLRNTLISNAVHNINRNEQEKQQQQQRNRSVIERKRSRTPSPRSSREKRDYHDDERSSKRAKNTK